MPADNRDYHYSTDSVINRAEYADIIKLVEPKSSVIDLACGDGSLLFRLQKEKQVTDYYGIELSPSGVTSARKKGLKIKLGKVDRPLIEIGNKRFDYSIINVSLQMVMRPEMVLDEMIRISHYQIVSFPNFGYLPNRIELLTTGRMPKTMLFGYSWYSTGQIHQLSVVDFENFCKRRHVSILKTNHFIPDRFGPFPQRILKLFPSLWAVTALYLLEPK